MTEIKRKFIAIIILANILITYNMTVGIQFVIAINENSENQITNIESTNLNFDVYMKQNDSSVYEKEMNTEESNSIFIDINIKDTGVLSNAVITFDEKNFNIDYNNLDITYIQDINEELNQITLNQIRVEENIVIEIPINFKSIENITQDYFNMDNVVTLSGQYQEDEDSIDIVSEASIKINWTSNNININVNSSFVNLAYINDEKILLEQKIVSEVENNALPKTNEILEIEIPTFEETSPTNIVVIQNGEKLSDDKIIINYETGILEINNDSYLNENNKYVWQEVSDEYIVIYSYPFDTIIDENQIVNNIQLSINLLNIENEINVNVNETSNVEISNDSTIVNIDVEEDIYKGYMYSQSEDTTYKSKYEVLAGNSGENSQVTLEFSDTNMIDINEQYYNITDYINIDELIINKDNMLNVFGEDGNIEIYNSNEQLIITINKDSEVDEEENIHIILEEQNSIIIKTTTVENEGILEIYANKSINANIENITIEQLKSVSYIEEKVISIENFQQKIELLDTVTSANLDISTSTLTSLEKNLNFEITIDLNINSNEYDLYKNPEFIITLPTGIKEIEINSINKVYCDELEIDNYKIETLATGEQQIICTLTGEQQEYINDLETQPKIIINLNLEFEVSTPTNLSKINIEFTNENGREEKYYLEKEIQIESKYGMVVYTKIEGYEDGVILESVNENITNSNLDPNLEEKIITVTKIITNNYENDIENLVMTLDGDRITNINTSKSITTYENTSSSELLAVGEQISITYDITIPENIGYDEDIINTLTVSGSVNGQSIENITEINLSAVKPEINLDDTTYDMIVYEGFGEIGLVASTAEIVLNDGESVEEGQSIKYTMKIKNTTENVIENIQAILNVNNAHVFDYVEYEVTDVYDIDPHNENFYEELIGVTESIVEIEKIESGETVTIEFQINVDQNIELVSGNISIKADTLDEDLVIQLDSLEVKETELKLTLIPTSSIETTIFDNRTFFLELNIENLTDYNKSDLNIICDFADGIEIEEIFENEDERISLGENNTINISELNAGESVSIYLFLRLTIDDIDNQEELVTLRYSIENENNIYYSNDIYKVVELIKYDVEIVQSASIENEQSLESGDTVTLIANVQNSGIRNIWRYSMVCFKFSFNIRCRIYYK